MIIPLGSGNHGFQTAMENLLSMLERETNISGEFSDLDKMSDYSLTELLELQLYPALCKKLSIMYKSIHMQAR